GEDAGVCPKCKRKSVHQFTGDCMNCGLTKEQIKWFHKDKDEIIKMLTDILYTHTDQTVMVINEVDYENVVNDIIEML
ncbi:MAG: hypothetical protein KJN62_04645, partial [Deltaproteobacteria bacterium]|nr:hypothetical protein [Deltaproteobacteria bacterium]